MRKVLLIAYCFPPRPGVASLRSGGLAKYFPQFGWEPIILTANLPGDADTRFRVIQTYYPGDVSARLARLLHLNPNKHLIDQIGLPDSAKQSQNGFFIKMIDIIGGILIYPDEEKAWFPYAVEAASRLIRQEKIEAVISSSAPVTSHIICKKLKDMFDIPWIADLRDLWSQTHLHCYDPFRKWWERRLEIKTLSSADALVTVSNPLAEKLGALHRGKSVYTILNGFDPEEESVVPLTKELTMTYTGLVYPLKQNPSLLFSALRDLRLEERSAIPHLRVRFYGQKKHWLEEEIKKYGVEDIVQQYGKIQHEEALMRQRESQVLLFFNWTDPFEKGVYSAKIFEYLSAQRPILSCGPEDVVRDLLTQTRAGTHCLDVNGVKQTLRRIISQHQSEGIVPYRGIREEINKYSYPEMARQFAEILNKIT